MASLSVKQKEHLREEQHSRFLLNAFGARSIRDHLSRVKGVYYV